MSSQLPRFRLFAIAMSTTSAASSSGPVEAAISRAITVGLQPIHLEVINESYMHNVPTGSETHFKVLVISERFVDVPLIKVINKTLLLFNWEHTHIFQRHRMVNAVVKEELRGQFVHALSIEAKTPQQWEPNTIVSPSPSCRGGFGK